MRLCLAIENGRAKGKRVEIPVDGELIGGRDPSASLRLPDVMVSRQHFRVRHLADGCEVEDLDSQNGTFLNDKRVEGTTSMRVGDVLRAGDTTLSLLEVESKGLIGKELAGYRVLERLGAGGMGTVFRATQLSLGREVAFKVLSSRLIEDTTFVDLFFKEARAAGALNHPNIVAVYDVGRQKGLYYLSMEYMPKGSVQDLLDREGKIAWTDAIRIVRDAARGLDYARQKQIVHRDIKPDNLMIAEDDAVKIADLGLAHNLAETGSGSEGIIGTPHFIAPEQAQGKKVDVRSDLYSLGASFYRMVVGRNPFHGRKVRDIIVAQVKEMPMPAHEADTTIPREVSAVIERLMQKDPDDRYATPGELIADLERAFERAGAGTGPSKGLWIGVGAAALAAIVGGWAMFGGGGDKPADPNDPDVVRPTGPAPTGPIAANGNGGGTDEAGGNGGGNGGAPDPAAVEQAARLRELEAKAAFHEVQSAEVTDAERITRYRAVAKKHDGTEYGRRAGEEASALAKRVAAADAARTAAVAALEQQWTDAKQAVADLLAESRFAAAHARVSTFIENHPTVDGVDHRPDAEALKTKIETDAASALAALETTAEALAAKEDFDGARAAFSPFAERVADAEAPAEVFTTLATKVATIRKALTERQDAARAKRYAAERSALITAYSDAFDAAERYRFTDAIGLLEAARKQSRVPSYRARYDVALDALRKIVAVRAAFIERGNRRDGLAEREVPLDRAMVGNETGTLKKVDEEDLQIEVRIRGRRNTVKRPWSEYPQDKYLELFNDDRWAMTPDERLGVAWLALLFGRHDIAMERARAAAVPAATARVEHECRAAALLDQLLEAARAEAWAKVRQHAVELRTEYADTIAFVRNTNGETALAKE